MCLSHLPKVFTEVHKVKEKKKKKKMARKRNTVATASSSALRIFSNTQ